MSDLQVQIIPVQSHRQLRTFAVFAERLYRESPYYVPEMVRDVMDAFTPSRNAAFEFCQAQPFLAVRGGKVVGRVAAIINPRANKVWKTNAVRFGWIDFIEDRDVARALIETVAAWGRERGMNRIEGPLGFTDFDREGMLTDGFDRLGTPETIYNHPYYPQYMEEMGFQPTAKWVEWLITAKHIPDRVFRIADAVTKRYELHTAVLDRSMSKSAARYAKSVFHLVNESYAPLYGYSAFSDRQIDDMVRKFLPVLNHRLVSVVLDKDDNTVAVGLTIPSLAKALQKSRGRMLPFGWWHLLKALRCKDPDILDMLFLAVKPEYQNKGLNAIPVCNVLTNAVDMGFQQAESNPELETNQKILNHWELFEGSRIIKRRCAFAKNL